MSKRWRAAPGTVRSAGTNRKARRSASRPSGTLTRKTERQPNAVVSRPPSGAPDAVPTADIVASSPMARPIPSLGTVSLTSAMDSATIIAPPRPWRPRAQITTHSDEAVPPSTEAPRNTRRPATSSLRRPTMSLSRPTLTISTVVASR